MYFFLQFPLICCEGWGCLLHCETCEINGGHLGGTSQLLILCHQEVKFYSAYSVIQHTMNSTTRIVRLVLIKSHK